MFLFPYAARTFARLPLCVETEKTAMHAQNSLEILIHQLYFEPLFKVILQDFRSSQLFAFTISIPDVHVVVIFVYISAHKSTRVAAVLASSAVSKLVMPNSMFYEIKWLIEWVTKLNYGWIIAVGLCQNQQYQIEWLITEWLITEWLVTGVNSLTCSLYANEKNN